MDSTILDIIKVHNFLGNKNNLEKNRIMKDKFLRDLNETEGISENNEIYERINRDRCNDEKIDGLVDYLNKNNNNRNNETIVEILKGLKISILDFIKSLINIFYYKTELIKRIEVTQIVSEFMKPLKWQNMEKYKKLESFFKRLDKGNNNRNREKEEKLETIIFNRATEIFVNQKINNWEELLKLEYKKDDNTDICKYKKDWDIQTQKNEFNEIYDRIENKIEVKNFEIKPDEVIFKYNENDILEKGEEQKKMFLYFLLILEVTYNINDLKGDFVFFKNISNINELYEGFHIFAKKVIGSLKKGDGKKKKKGDKGKKKKGDKGKKKKKKQSGGARKKKKSIEFKKEQLKKKLKSENGSKKGKDGNKKDNSNKKVKDKNLEKFDQLTELIKFKKGENNNNEKIRSGKSLKKMLEGLKVYQYTMFDYQNDSYLKNEIFKKIKEIKNVVDNNDPSKFTQKTKTNRNNLAKIFCESGQQGNDTKKTFNIFKPIYSEDTGDYFIGEDDMVNGKIQKLNTFLLPYTDKYGNDVKGYLRRNLNNENIKKIIKDVFNLYSGILYIQLNFLLRMYLRVREQSIVEELIEKDNRLDLMTPEAKNKNKNSKNGKSNNGNGKSNNGNVKSNNKNSNLKGLNENKNLTIKEINKNMLKLQHIKELYDKKKMEIIHNNSYNNKNREKALQLINQQVKNIINKLNKLKNGN